MAELEDRFYRLLEQHHQLKKEHRNNQSHMRHLNARLARLMGEKKRKDQLQRSPREIDMEELLFDMHTRMAQLERENMRLKEASLVLKSQLSSRVRVFSSYTHITARVDSGIGHRTQRLNRLQSKSALAINKIPSACSCGNYNFVDHLTSASGKKIIRPSTANVLRSSSEITAKLLEEARDEIESLEQIIARQQQQLQDESKLGECKESSRKVREESEDYQVNEKVLVYVEQLKSQLKQAREECSQLQKQQLTSKSLEHKIDEMTKRIGELEEDKEILERSLHRCLDSCMDDIKSGLAANAGHKEKQLLEPYLCHLRQLQEHCQRLQREKDLIQKELMAEREVNSRLESENERLLLKHQEALTLYANEHTSRQQQVNHRPKKQLQDQQQILLQLQHQQQLQHLQLQLQEQGEYGSSSNNSNLLLPTSEHELQMDSSLGYSNSESLLDELQGMRQMLERALQQETSESAATTS